ncbi:chloramphenicol phosphotransferase CPT family protein [Bacillus sp. FJAT-27245]|uniref:chloramphenicol phosphotransferase CPT family protein n=1 Tax=Bacillus sp. FJAT-27245 TaxID=1684144 RepID=UPI0006A791E1|nr:AAA family ATPase [Bacillus sp. FJAT-27245]
MELIRSAKGSNGKIIFLNGASSSGKTSLANELVSILEEPYIYLSADQIGEFLESFISEGYNPYDEKMIKAFYMIRPSMMALFHHFIKFLAMIEKNVIVDHIVLLPAWLKEFCELLSDYSVYFIGVHCSLEELERRELARGNRKIGSAKAQLEQVHKHIIYDYEVDTSNASSRECALMIKEYLNNEDNIPSAFAEIKQTL